MAVDAAVMEANAGAPPAIYNDPDLQAAYDAAMAEVGTDAGQEPARDIASDANVATDGAPAGDELSPAPEPSAETDAEPGELPENLRKYSRSERAAIWEFARSMRQKATEELQSAQEEAAKSAASLAALEAERTAQAQELRDLIGDDAAYNGLHEKVIRDTATYEERAEFGRIHQNREMFARHGGRIRQATLAAMGGEIEAELRAAKLDPAKIHQGATSIGAVIRNAIAETEARVRAELDSKVKAAEARLEGSRMRQAATAGAPTVTGGGGNGRLPWSDDLTDDDIERAKRGEFRGLRLGD